MDDFEEQTVVVEMPCGHLFCESGCLVNWLKNSNCCPLCRVVLPEEEAEDEAEDEVQEQMDAVEYHGIARLFGDETEEGGSDSGGDEYDGVSEVELVAEDMTEGLEPAPASSIAAQASIGGWEVDPGGW